MSIPERMIVSATVKTRAEEENGWVLELDIPQFKSKYPTKVTRVPEAIAKLLAPRAEPYSIVLLRENLKKDKTGTQPYDYYWGLEGLATPAETAAKAKEPEPVDTKRNEIAWGQAINCAVARMGVGAADDVYFKVMTETANRFYPIILGGPNRAQDARIATPEAIAEDSGGEQPQMPIPTSVGELLTQATTPVSKGGLGLKNRTEVFQRLGIQSALEIASLGDAWAKLQA